MSKHSDIVENIDKMDIEQIKAGLALHREFFELLKSGDYLNELVEMAWSHYAIDCIPGTKDAESAKDYHAELSAMISILDE